MGDTTANPSGGAPLRHSWAPADASRLIGRGHTAGDFLEAYDWVLVEERKGELVLDIALPEHVRNPRGQLFGGFTPTYVDLIALFTVRAGPERLASPPAPRGWLATTNMRIDYFDPITGPRFRVDSRVERRRGRTSFVVTRFFQDGDVAVHALTTLRHVPPERPLGDA